MMTTKLLVRIDELSADEAEEHGHDSTLRTEHGPLVRVTFTREDGSLVREQVAVLTGARIHPAYVEEV